ncbi:MAG: hypothetical protein LQ348_006235 [Seirophora lacunosa]|nr:MAG: hypothetical protein LQ348_006235 [Seirophora lacunosa]
MSATFTLFLLAIFSLLSGISARPSTDSFQQGYAVSVLSEREAAPGPAAASNLTAVEGPKVLCSGERYRTDLIGSSCADAVRQIPALDERLRFRTRPGGEYDIGLPLRFVSADGKCIVEPVLKDLADTEVASWMDFIPATTKLLNACATNLGIGGIATDIGENGKLGLIMTSYEPHVECTRSAYPPALPRCQRLIGVMLASTQESYWGNGGDRRTLPDVFLPKYLREC